MSDGLRPYPEYRDSGIPWLGAIPAHWEIRRAKYLYREVDERSVTGEEELLSVSHLTGVTPRRQKAVTMFMAESYAGHKLCQPGDLVVNTMWAWMGALGVARRMGIVSPAYGVYRQLDDESLTPGFADLLLRTPGYVAEYTRRSTGIRSSRLRLYPEQFLSISLVFPPPAEQRRLLSYLHAQDIHIARFIRNRRRLIELLNEQRQAIITHAVTRGLDPDVRLKPSGVDWLGDVPEHWTLRRFKFVARVNSGQVDPRDVLYRDLPLIAPNHIESRTGRIIAIETANDQGAISGKYLVHQGQIIYSKIRPNLRKIARAPFDCLCSADMYPIEILTSEIKQDFLIFLMTSDPFTRYATDCSMRVAMPKVNREALADGWLWFPSLMAQDDILRQLARELRPLDDGLAAAQREMTLIREYRTRLVSDVVTGKLDVRHLAPDRVEADLAEIEALDVQEDEDEDAEIAEDTNGAES